MSEYFSNGTKKRVEGLPIFLSRFPAASSRCRLSEKGLPLLEIDGRQGQARKRVVKTKVLNLHRTIYAVDTTKDLPIRVSGCTKEPCILRSRWKRRIIKSDSVDACISLRKTLYCLLFASHFTVYADVYIRTPLKIHSNSFIYDWNAFGGILCSNATKKITFGMISLFFFRWPVLMIICGEYSLDGMCDISFAPVKL